jgi:NitT/TauT family transport system substrate-binding protein
MTSKHNHRQESVRLGAHWETRRGFLCHCCFGAVTAGMLAAINRPARSADAVTVKATHGTGFCNMGIFLVHELALAEADGVHLEFVNTPTIADITSVFGAGQVDASLIPYTNFFTLIDKGAPVKIVSGGGVEGCIIVAKPGIASAEDCRGKTLGTFQADTLEVLPYDWLKMHGISFQDLDVRFFGTSPEMAQAFIAGSVDMICHIEPYATQALEGVQGATILSDGTDVYHKGYTDCVLAVSERLIEENRDAVKALIKALMVAQQKTEADRKAMVELTIGKYYKTPLEVGLNASMKQPNVVDQRDQEDFMIERSKSVVELGYISKELGKESFDWSILEDVIAENPELYDSLQLKSKV